MSKIYPTGFFLHYAKANSKELLSKMNCSELTSGNQIIDSK